MPIPATTTQVSKRPTLCLNMIVRNEAHIVSEVLDSVASFIDTWVIVDTGSDDGTQDLVRNYMSRRGIPGQLYERPWLNFGHNRTEALMLAQGHADYIWVMDADDQLIGRPDFTQLRGDIGWLRCIDTNDHLYWLPALFRDGARVRWVGVTHEYATWDDAYDTVRLDGDYHVADRHLSARNAGGDKLNRDRDLLLAELERDPEDSRSIFYLAQTFYCMGDHVTARKWYTRRAEMGGFDEEVYFSLWRIAESMSELGAPWRDIEEAYLKAWEYRPSRAEPLWAIARHYRTDRRFQLGYLFAKRAAEIPLPAHDALFVHADIYSWRAADEQAVCASWTGRQPEAFTIWRRLLAGTDLPEHDRQRIATNRDVCVPTMLEQANTYPDTLAASLRTHPGDPNIVVTLTAGPDLPTTENTLNTFLHCCRDISRVGRFLLLDTTLTTQDHTTLLDRYGFLHPIPTGPDDQPDAQLAHLRHHIHARYWLHLGQGWKFFAPEDLITRLIGVLDAEPDIARVGINLDDATTLTGLSAPDTTTRHTPHAGRYTLTDNPTNTPANAPAMTDTTRPNTTHTATLDEVLCIEEGSRAV